MRVCEEFSKIQDPELIHPSDKKYNKALEKRQRRDKKNGGFIKKIVQSFKTSRYYDQYYSFN